MAGPKCPRCAQQITPGDPLAFYGALIFHLDCQRPHTLSREERTLLFRYCWEHVVAKCSACEQRFKQYQLGADLLAHRAYLCPRCRADLTESLRGHLYECATLPDEIRLRAREARDAAWRLVSDGRPRDEAMRQAEAAVAMLRETIERTVWGS
jgi:hypothetical protein